MIRKSIWGAIFVNSALALAFAIYTVVAIATGLGVKKSSPSATEVALALRVGDEFKPVSGQTAFEGKNGEVELVNGKYIAKLADDNKFKCTVTKSDKSKVIYNVTVFDYGTGEVENPYNITKASDLTNLDGNGADIHNNVGAHYILRSDIDMAGIAWTPVGTRFPFGFSDQIHKEGNTYSKIVDVQTSSKFTGSFDANGFAIKNLTIEVNRENINDYIVFEYNTDGTDCFVKYAYLDVGFFGCVDSGASIVNAKFENAKITLANNIFDGSYEGVVIADENYPAEEKTIKLDCWQNRVNGKKANDATAIVVSFGVTAGSVANASVKNITIENSKVTAGSGNGSYSGIGMVAGVARFVDMSNITINNSELDAIVKLTYAGGVVGAVEHNYGMDDAQTFYYANVDEQTNKQTKLANVTISDLTIKGDSYTLSETGGIFGIASGAVVSDVNATNIKISLLGGYDDNTGSTTVAGAVGSLYDVKTLNGTDLKASLKNVAINADINAADAKNVWNIASGVVCNSASKLENVSFAGTIKGSVVAGIALQNEGEITYTDDFAGIAVDANVEYKIMAAGITCYNYGGTIKGGEQKAAVVKFAATNTNLTNTTAAAAGVAVYNFAGSVENISVQAKSYKTVNFGGAVCYFGNKASETIQTCVIKYQTNDNRTTFTYGAALSLTGDNEASGIEVAADVVTKAYGEGAYADKVGGFAAVVNGNSAIGNVNITLNVNQLNKENTYYAYMVAGFAADVNGQAIEIDSANIVVKIFVNESGTQVEDKFISLAAGAIVNVSGSDISINDITISSSQIEDVIGRNKEDESTIHNASGAYAFIAKATAATQNAITIDHITISGTNLIAHFNASKQVISTNQNAKVGENITIGEDVIAVSDQNA